MNTTGCPPLYAFDNFFSRQPASETCDLNIPLFVIVIEVAALIHLAVALKRTQVIVRNRSKRQGRSKSSQSRCVSMTPFVNLLQSWGAFFTCLVTPVVWYFFAPAGFMLAVEGMIFNVQCELWLAKLIRLGGRIIPSTAVSSIQSSSSSAEKDAAESETRAIFDQLAQSDRPIQIMQAISRLLLVTQFVSGAIAFPIVASAESFLIRFTVGLEAPLGWMYAGCLIWQYLRCEAAIKKTSALTKRMLVNQEQNANATLSAVKKMRQQRYILIFFSTVACVLAVLFAVEVIPIRYWLFLVAQSVDSSIEGTMLYALFRKSKKKKAQATEGSSTTNNNRMNNNNNVFASSPSPAAGSSVVLSLPSRID